MRERPRLESPEGDPLSSPPWDSLGRELPMSGALEARPPAVPGTERPWGEFVQRPGRLHVVTPAHFSDKESGEAQRCWTPPQARAVSLGRALGLPCLLLQSGSVMAQGLSNAPSVQPANSKKPHPQAQPFAQAGGGVCSCGQPRRLEPLSPAPLSPVTQ